MKKLVWRASGLMSLAFFSMQTPLFAQAPAPATAVNTIYDEQNPVQAPDGQLYFTIGYHPSNKGGATDPGDVYRSRNLEQAAEPVSDLSTQSLDVLVGFPDAQTAYVYHARGPLGQGVHRYLKSGSNWNLVGMLKMGNFRNNSNHFSGRLLADGKTILMAMNSFGSFGNDDLYVSTQMEGDNWTSPVNLGPVVNTFAEEQSPFYDEKNGILYFSSNQADSRGGKEVFYAVRQGEDWTSWSRPKPFEIPGALGAKQVLCS
ncbi:glycoside hydrolase family protein [Nitritalea halalkaliphila]|nr:hypothetical protein [Nitritalea halalkaliphila]